MVELKNYAKNRINAFYSNHKVLPNWKHKLLNQYLPKEGKFLDVGCASGYMSKLFKNKNRYYGIDYNPEFVNFCKKMNLDVKLCDLGKEKIPFKDNVFDVAYCSHVIEHLTSREQNQALKEISRVLKKGGVLILFAPTPYHWYFWDDHTHVRPCTHGQLKSLAKDSNFNETFSKYSNLRFFPYQFQRWLRLPPMRFFLWEVFLIAKK